MEDYSLGKVYFFVPEIPENVMLKRKIEQALLKWKQTAGRKPLVIKGIRQCGKTFIVQQFAREHYEHVVYVNFILTPTVKTAFAGNVDVDTMVLNLSAFRALT